VFNVQGIVSVHFTFICIFLKKIMIWFDISRLTAFYFCCSEKPICWSWTCKRCRYEVNGVGQNMHNGDASCVGCRCLWLVLVSMATGKQWHVTVGRRCAVGLWDLADGRRRVLYSMPPVAIIPQFTGDAERQVRTTQ